MNSLGKIFAAFALVVTTTSTAAYADTYVHIDQLACRLDRQSKLLVSETRHYRHTPGYCHLVADTREICALADHIHELALSHGSLAHLEHDVAQLCVKFQHLQTVVHRIERDAHYGHGQIFGNTAHVWRVMRSMEDTIRHLQADLRLLRVPRPVARPVAVQRPPLHFPANDWRYQRPSPAWGGYGSFGRGFSIGGGSSRITFRF